MRGPDSESPWFESGYPDDWPDEPEPILSIPCPCCKGDGHGQSHCQGGIDLYFECQERGEVFHPIFTTPLAEWPGCWVCFDAGVVPGDEEAL